MGEWSGGAGTRICGVADFRMPASRLVTASSSLGYPSWPAARLGAGRRRRVLDGSQSCLKTFNIVFSAAATLFGSARLCDREIEVGVGVGLVFEGVVPPFAVVGIEAAVLHDAAEVVPVFRFG